MLWLRASTLVVVGAALGLAVNGARPDGVRFSAAPAATSCESSANVPSELSPVQAAALCKEGGVVVADARSAERYAQGHVADAIHLPCDAAGAVASEALGHFIGAKTILVYGETTEEARPVAVGLLQRIHDPTLRVVVLAGGFRAWDQAGLACASGPCVECKDPR